MTDREEPVIHDKRRIDPETGKLREGVAATAAPSAGAAQPPNDPSGSEDAGEGSLAELKAENAQLADELARANASLYNVNQEYANYVRRSKEAASAARQEGIEKVVTTLLSVLDDVELARQHGDLTGPLGSMAEKFESTLSTNFQLERFGAPGEEFDPMLHEALMDSPSEDVEVVSIAQVIQPGYRMGDKVLRAARVATNSPA